MKTNVTTKRVNILVITLLTIVFNLFVVSCSENGEDDYNRNLRTESYEDRYAKAKPGKPELDWNFSWTTSNHTSWAEVNWTLTESAMHLNENGIAKAVCSHEHDRYAIPEDLKNETLAYVQEHTTASNVVTKSIASSASRKEYQDSIRYTAECKDGNLAYLDITTSRLAQIYNAVLDTTIYNLAQIKVKNVRVKNIENLPGTTAMTRGTYVSDSIVRRITWEITFEVIKGDIADNMSINPSTEFNVELQDMWKVLLLSEDEIERAYSRDKKREVLNDKEERCSFVEVFVMKSGETHENPKSIILNRELKGIDEYTKTVSSFAYTWRSDNATKRGSVSKGIRTEGNWTVDSRTDSFSANISNDAEPIVTEYTFKHEGATYKDEWLEESFELITPTWGEKASRVESIVSDNNNYDMARLFNEINTTYLGYAQSCGETVKLQKPAVRIEREYWDEFKCVETIYNDSVVWTPLYVIEYTDGNRIETRFRFSDDRDLVVLTNWSSIEENESQSTGNVTVGEATTRSMSATSNGATCTWTRETRELSNTAKLAGSNQTNKWRSIEPNGVTVTYRGKSFTFNRNSIQTVNNATVSGGAENNGYKVYSYSDVLEYHFGDNTKNIAAPGTIRVKVEEPIVEPTITSEYFENASQVITDSLVKWNIDYVTKWSDGKIERVSFACNASRSLHQTTNWSSIEANSNQSTNSATGSVTNSLAQSKTVNGAVFSWTRETRSIKSVATLAGSTQNNGWEAVDPVGCTVTYKGKSHSFAKESISMSNNATVNGGSESNGYKVFNYRDKLGYSYGNNTKYSSAPGTIRVKVEEPVDPTFFPESWGEILEAKQTVANNEAHTGFVYTWSLRFKNGYVLPVVIRSNSTQPEWHFEYVEKTAIAIYNGGSYEASTKKWINTTAKDTPSIMTWSRADHVHANKDYSEAQSQKWDEGRLVNGHASVTTNRYTLTISNGYLSAKDTYTGKNMGTWSSYVD